MTGPNGAAPHPFYEDAGLGYCLLCLMEYKAGQRATKPEFAITRTPVLIPAPDPMGRVAGQIPVPLPACYDHVGAAQKKGGLIVAGGGLS